MLESKRRAIIFLSISFLLAVAAGLFVLQKVSAMNEELGGMTKVYVAAADIPSRTLIQPNQVTTVELPNRYVNETSHVLDVNELINKVLVVPLSEGDIITTAMIKPVSAATDENKRLVMIPQGDKVHFDSMLEAFDRVDIVVSQKFGDKPVTEVFMKDVNVANILEKEKKFNGVVVEVAAEDAPKIIHMQNYADSMRVLKANVGKADQINTTEANGEQEAAEKAAEKAAQEAAQKEEADKASTESKDKDQ